MRHTSRREFLLGSAAMMAAGFMHRHFDVGGKRLRLSFSTLGCPDWTFAQTVAFAKEHGYSGIEMRGILRQLDLTKCPEFNTEQSRAQTMTLMKDNGLVFVDLGSSANMHVTEAVERKKNLDEGRAFIDLAVAIHCPFVRVYPNKFPPDQEKAATIKLIAAGLHELGEYAKGKKVIVLMETHGDAVHADDLVSIMTQADHPNVGLVWDISNMWTVTRESPADVYQKIGKYVHHTHIKDAKLVNNEPHYVLLGNGEVPIFDAIELLEQKGYKGYYSFEWEKLWHPELDAPEVSLADYPVAMKKHFKS